MKNTAKTMFTLFAVLIFSAIAFGQSSLNAIDGKRVDLDERNGRITVLAIGAAWLPLSTKQVDFTNALAKRYQGREVNFYFVVTDSANSRSKSFASDEDIRKFAADKKIGVPVLRDPEGSLTMRKYKLDQVPTFVIVDRNGNASIEQFGGLDPKFDVTGPISRTIDRLLASPR